MPDVNPLESLGDDLMVFTVTFGEDAVEVDFLDPRRQGDGLHEITKLAIERRVMRDEIERVEELLRDLIDDALRERRK